MEPEGRDSSVQMAQLRAFVMVADCGSLTLAAERLGYTEPAVHLQIRALATAMGGRLFERAHRKMQPTELGTLLLPLARTAVASVADMAAEASTFRAVTNRVVRVGVGRSTGSYLFPHLAAAVREHHPDIVLEPSLMSVGDIYQAVGDGVLDIGYASGLREQRALFAVPKRRIVAVPFREYHWVLVASPRLATTGDDPGAIKSIFLPAYAELMAGRLMTVLPDAAHHKTMLSQDTEAAKAAAVADLGLACVPAYTVRSEVLAGTLVRCYADSAPLTSVIHVAHERPPRHPDVALVVAATRRLAHFSVDGGLNARPVADAISPSNC